MLQRLREWHGKHKRAVRLLLLTRNEDTLGLRALLKECDLLHTLTLHQLSLPPLQPLSLKDARTLAMRVRESVRDTPPFVDEWEDTTFWQAFDAWLEGAPQQHGMPLLIIAAVLHALHVPKKGFSLTHRELLLALAEREELRACAISREIGLKKEALPRLLALATLAGGLNGNDIKRLAELDGISSIKKKSTEDKLRKTPWWHNSVLQSLTPDRPAAAFVISALNLHSDKGMHSALSEWLWAALRNKAENFCERLPRLIFDIGEIDKKAAENLLMALVTMIKNAPQRAAYFQLITIQNPHLAAPFAAITVKMLAEQATTKKEKALHLVRLAACYYYMGNQSKAMQQAERVIEMCQSYGENNPEELLPNLAASLSNVSIFLSESGRHEEALDPAYKSVAIYRSLTKKNSKKFLPILTMSLNNLAYCLSISGRHKEALAPAKEAVKIRRKLSASDPTFRPYLASSLDTLSNALSGLGRYEEALFAAQEAIDIRREFATRDQASFLPYLARSLATLAKAAYGLKQYGTAADIITEAIEKLQSHFMQSPSAHAWIMRNIVNEYMKIHKKANRKVNNKLIKLINNKLSELNGGCEINNKK